MPTCGSQCVLCDLPVRFDPYEGCSHGCKYCFAQRYKGLDVKLGESPESLSRFIHGGRVSETRAFDWDIPLHIGGMSDPLQPAEKEYGRMKKCLEILAEEGYPAVLSTKGRLLCEEPYISLIEAGKIVVQISMACSLYDRLETGAPTFIERLDMLKAVSKRCLRTIVRVQPYFHEAKKEIKGNLEKYKDNGAYGVIFEGMKFFSKRRGLVRVGGDFVYPKELLEQDFEELKAEAHRVGLRFFCGENRLREMGDSLTCCGIEGLEGFVPNAFNAAHILNGDIADTTEAMRKPCTAGCFAALYQTTLGTRAVKRLSFKDAMEGEVRKYYLLEALGKTDSRKLKRRGENG